MILITMPYPSCKCSDNTVASHAEMMAQELKSHTFLHLVMTFRTSLIDVLGTALLVAGFWILGYGKDSVPPTGT